MHTSKNDATCRVVKFRAASAQQELERLNRLTGLAFHTLPTSLINKDENWGEFAEDLIECAISIWAEDIAV